MLLPLLLCCFPRCTFKVSRSFACSTHALFVSRLAIIKSGLVKAGVDTYDLLQTGVTVLQLKLFYIEFS